MVHIHSLGMWGVAEGSSPYFQFKVGENTQPPLYALLDQANESQTIKGFVQGPLVDSCLDKTQLDSIGNHHEPLTRVRISVQTVTRHCQKNMDLSEVTLNNIYDQK